MLVDLHIHSRFSFDSDEEPINYVERARFSGATALGFSEHYDYDAVLDGADVTPADIPAYLKAAAELQRKYDSTEILHGIEFGYRDFAVNKYKELSEKYDFDYIINSVHTLPERGDCFRDSFFEGRPIKESYRDYFLAVLESVKAEFDYQIIGHIGYVSRYRSGAGTKIIYSDFSDIIDEILTEIIARDKCLEINASTGRTAGDFLPDTDIIDRYFELGGKKLSYGSDAHSVDRYLQKSDELIKYLKSRGVDTLYYYRKRQAIPYKI